MRDMLRALYRHRVYVLASFALVSVVTLIAVAVLPAHFTATARVLIRPEALAAPSYVSGTGARAPGSGFLSEERRLETEIQLASLRAVVDAAVQETGTTYDQVYHSPTDHWVAPFAATYNAVRNLLSDSTKVDRKSFEATVDAVSKSLHVGLVKPAGAEVSSTILEFSVPATDPKVAQDLLSAIVNKYLSLQADMAQGSAEQALIAVTNQADFATGEVESLRTQLNAVLAAGASANGRGGAIGQNRSPNQLQNELLAAEAELAKANRIFLETADTVQHLRQRVEMLKGRIQSASVQTATPGITPEILRERLQAAETRETELQNKVREVEFALRSSGTPDNNRLIVEPPRLPTTSDWTTRLSFVVFGVMSGVCAGLLLLGFRELTSNSLRTSDDIRRTFGVSPVGVIGRESIEDIRLAVSSRNGQRASTGVVMALRRIASRLERLREEETILEPVRMARGSIVLVSGAHANAGTSTVTLGLASILGETQADSAFLGEPTVVAIATESTSRPMADTSHQLESGTSHTARIAPTQSQFTIIGNTLHDGVGVVDASERRAAARPQFTTSLVERHRVVSTVVELSVRHRWVLVDGGPHDAGLSDALAPLVDFRMLVVDASRTGRQLVRDIVSDSSGDNIAPMMFVLNRVEKELPPFLYNRM